MENIFKVIFTVCVIMAALLVTGCSHANVVSEAEPDPEKQQNVRLQIFASSDIHGWYMPYDYILNEENNKGSMAQIATAVDMLRDEYTILIDAGDFATGNNSEIFTDAEKNPMIDGVNFIGYDYFTTGNHGYNFGTDALISAEKNQSAKLLCGNVYDNEGNRLGTPYDIKEIGGVKVGIIGMVTPNIKYWDKDNLEGWTVTDPVEEIRKCMDEIKDEADVLVGVMHMDVENELQTPHSGVRDIAESCPEFDVIIASHGHSRIDDLIINGVPIIENDDCAETLGQIVIDVERENDGWKVADVDVSLLEMKDYEAQKEFCEMERPYHERSLAEAERVIGVMDSDYLAAPDEMKGIHTAFVEDTGVHDFINEVLKYYSGAKVVATGLKDYDSNLYRGDIRNCDISKLYGYNNTVATMKMNGAQLKKWMEWSAAFYNKTQPGDLTISFNENMRMFCYDVFSGVNYDLDISEDAGSRIKNLTWPDGSPVKDDEEFLIATSDYRVNSVLAIYGDIYKEGEELPEVVEVDLRSDIGDVQMLIKDYIANVKGGHIKESHDNNWKIIGYDFDDQYREMARKMLESGILKTVSSADRRTPNVKSITIDDVKAANEENHNQE